MKVRLVTLYGGALALTAAIGLAGVGPAQALSMKECGTKYQAAKTAGTLNGLGWNDFRKAQCGDSAMAPATTAPVTPAAVAVPAKPVPAKPPANSMQAMPAGNAVFPNAIAPQYATLSAGTGRQKTCVDQYNANKATNGNGGMKWIEKGGGYWSACNKHLKG